MRLKPCIAYLLRAIIGLLCGIIGWIGVSAIVGVILVKLTNVGRLGLSEDNIFLISLAVGGLFGAIPLAKMGSDWISKKCGNQ